jgi:hypothetical protein
MFGPLTTDNGAEIPQPERETVIKFVISGPFLNAEAAHTQWSAEPPASSVMQDLMRRISELERKLDEERALVLELSRQAPSGAAAAPVRPMAVAPPVSAVTLAPPAAPRPSAPEAKPQPAPPMAGEPASRPPAAPIAESAARTIEPGPPLAMSTVAQTPPPKVRGLRRMIGALRRQ